MSTYSPTTDPRTAHPQPPYPAPSQRRPGHVGDMDPKPDHGEESWVGRGRLTDRVAVVTGGDSGIGRAVTIAMSREGADILFTHLPSERDEAREVAKLVEDAGRSVKTVVADLRDEDTCRQVIDAAVDRFGRIDVLVNIAGTQHSVSEFEDITDEMLREVYEVNLFSMFHLTRYALPHMAPGASVINTTSIQSSEPSPHLLHYSTTKAAIINFTEGLAKELAERGIRVNAVAPGATWTPLIPATMPDDVIENFGAASPLGRAAQPVEMSGAYVFLASDEASYISGETIAVTGGRSL